MSARSRAELFALADAALQASRTEGAEVIATEEVVELTRFAKNGIHQNVAERALQLRARVIGEGRVGVAEIRGEGEDSVLRLMLSAERARSLAAASEAAPLPGPDGGSDSPVAFSEATAAASPEQRADLVAVIAAAAARQNLFAYGALSTTTTSTAIINSAGVRRHAATTQASMVTVVRGDAGAGYASRHAVDIARIDAASLAAEVIDTCLRNQNPDPIDPGDYEVVLSPYAVADILEHLSWIGFNALAKQEHRSFMRIGERLMSDGVTIVDDPGDAAVFPFPFDGEGVSSRAVDLIDRGVCSGFVYDTPTALRDRLHSTGHSLPQPNTWGPYARHLVMRPGTVDAADLIRGVRSGIYITRLWYVRDVHPLRTLITGMTREGTFLINAGRLSRPVRDLRFTQSMVQALADVHQISRETHLELGEDGTAVSAPWLHVGRFTFTS